jgi:hypothetical protein
LFLRVAPACLVFPISQWKFHFYSGGVGTFLMAFMELMKSTRAQARRLAAENAPLAEARPIMAEAQVAVCF